MNNNNYRMQQPPPSVPVTGYPAPPYQNGGGQQYPYVAYPQQAPLYYNNNNNNDAPFATRSFFRAFIGTMICLIIIFSIILLITFLVLRPSFPSFQLTSISISDFNTSSQLLSATWHISFLTFNRNKKISVTYNALRSAIFYRSYFLTDSQLPPFKAETMSENTINATLALSQTYVEPFVIRGLNTDINQRGSITFDVQLISATSFHSGSWRFRSLLLKVLCEDVSISISSNATSANANFIHGPPKCQVWS
ncbi:putative immunoglobulin-like protein [Lupinus albus]|uniref:Putative immunoglobulin-like protein n=1 Tax=Lupinus albus TaxID=3870 RepID=A0A6A4PGT4_LUPAL|nr:putative immunoglobulin-like protein [Lupinus albus]